LVATNVKAKRLDFTPAFRSPLLTPMPSSSRVGSPWRRSRRSILRLRSRERDRAIARRGTSGAGSGSDDDRGVTGKKTFWETFADVEDLMRDTGFAPSTPIAHGVRNFVTWYRDYFKV
jgi:hypothetical protein